MKKTIVALIFTFFIISINAQDKEFDKDFIPQGGDFEQSDNNKKAAFSPKAPYTDYKIISYAKDTAIIDTTLNLQKEYKFNYLRKDNFELLEFHNQGQTFNKLGYDFGEVSLFPEMGARAKHFNYLETKDINYYNVPTPVSEAMYRTGSEQGQVLDVFFTLNFSKQLNTSIAYKGLRSLGKYRNALSSHGNFRTTFNYHSKNNQYFARGHIVSQDLFNTENGGLTNDALVAFIDDNPDFLDRGRLEVNLNDTDNMLEGKRYYFEHDYKLLSSKDSIQKKVTNLKLGHVFSYETKHFRFNQNSATEHVFGETDKTIIKDHASEKTMNNQMFLAFKSPYILGNFKVKTNYFSYNYSFNSAHLADDGTVKIANRLKGNTISFGAEWNASVDKFHLKADAASTISGGLSGNYITAQAMYKKDSITNIKASLSINSKAPNFNFLLFQSDYEAYNWQNDFKNENTRNLSFSLNSKWLNAGTSITQISNYTYFNDEIQPKPVQATSTTVNYLKVKINKEFKLGKFALDNTAMYQKVTEGASIFRVPELVTRNTFYFTSYLFKGKPLLLQTGVTFKYFTKYKSNAYNPLLGEFVLQNTDEIGGYPILDFFLNGQIKRTRIYFKVENFTSEWTGRNYFSAPNHPYKDWLIRFGLVWNWFN